MIRCGMMKQEKFFRIPCGEGDSGYDTMRDDQALIVFLGSPAGGEGLAMIRCGMMK